MLSLGACLTALIIPALLALASAACALDLPESARTQNIGGRCTFACLETIGHARDIAPLKGLLAKRGGVPGAEGTSDLGYEWKVRQQLQALRVPHRIEENGTYNWGTLKRSVGPCGVVVTVRAGTAWMNGKTLKWAHSILLVEYDGERVGFYCPDQPHRIWHASREWFRKAWAGNSVVVEDGPRGADEPEPQPAPRILTITLSYAPHKPLDSPGTTTWRIIDADGLADWGAFAEGYVRPLESDPEVKPYFRSHIRAAVKSLKDLGQIEAVDRIELGDGAFVRCSVEAAGGEL